MGYEVVIQPRATLDVEEAYLYIFEQEPESAAKWYRNLRRDMNLLSEMPSGFGIAPESNKLGCELRQKLSGRRSSAYRIIYRIDDQTEIVHLLAVRHGARRPIEEEDIE